MNTFAFMIHPIEPQKDVARKFPLLGKLPPGVIDYFSSYFPPVLLSHITGVRSEATGDEIEGWLVACPMTPRRLLQVSLPAAYSKMVQTGRLAERLGARILGVGAFTSVVGDAGITVANRLAVPVTTGNSYTVALAVEASLAAARRVDLDPERCVAAVVGAYGSTGRACARLLARSVPRLILIGRQRDRLEAVGQEIQALGPTVDLAQGMDLLPQADIVLAVTSSLEPIIEPEHLKSGAVVCDVARPRNVSRQVSERRDDVLVIEGGVVDVPGPADFHFNFGFPPGKAYACMAETMVLAMEGRFEDYTLGRRITTERVDEIARLAAKHGFRLSGFRSFERVVPEEQIERVRRNVQRCHLVPVHGLG
ncbi:MAG TPA: shikimate dehydrogenase [Anaerolineae bacterium]|nr:shikimate dehydrogenase [Anaerolineae bacterium]